MEDARGLASPVELYDCLAVIHAIQVVVQLDEKDEHARSTWILVGKSMPPSSGAIRIQDFHQPASGAPDTAQDPAPQKT